MKTLALVCNSAAATYHFRGDYIREAVGLGVTVSSVSLSEHKSGRELTALCNGKSIIFKSPFDPVGLREAFAIVRGSDVVHSFTHLGNIFSLILCRRRQTVVCTVTGLGRLWCSSSVKHEVARRALTLMYRWLLVKADALIFQNSDDKHFFEQEILSAPRLRGLKVFQTPGSGVNVDQCLPHRRAKGGTERLRIGFFSRADPLKGVKVFYKVAAALGAEHQFIHAGHLGKDEYAPSRIQATAEQCRVTYLGVLADPLPAISGCDIVLLPTVYREGVPRLLLECFALGVPTICYNGPGISDHVQHGINSYLAENEEEIVNLIRGLTNADLKRISEEQKRYAQERFSTAFVTRTYLSATGLVNEAA